MVSLSVSDNSSARCFQPAWKSTMLVTYRPFQLKPCPLSFIICWVAPSAAIGNQIAGPTACMGTDTSLTMAPSPANTSAALRTFSFTKGSDCGQPKPSVTMPMRMPLTPPFMSSA